MLRRNPFTLCSLVSSVMVAAPSGISLATDTISIIAPKLAVSSLPLNAVTASPDTPASEAYLPAQEISIVTPPRTPSAAHKSASCMLSPQGRARAGKTGARDTTGSPARK